MILTLIARLRLFALVAVTALLATACGSGADVERDPGGALRDAVAALADYAGYELTFRIDGEDAALARALEDDGLDPDTAQLVGSASIRLQATGEGDDAAAAYTLLLDGDEAAELRVLPDTDLYVRVDLSTLQAFAGDSDMQASIDEFRADAAMMGLGDVVDAIEAGGWVHVTGLQQMMNLFGGMGGTQDDLDEAEAERVAEELVAAAQRFLEQDVEITYLGSEDAGERVRATTTGAALQRLLSEMVDIATRGDLVDGLGADQLARDLDDVPADLTFSLDAWISGGQLSQVAIDLDELAEGEFGGPVLLLVEIAEFSGSIDAPADAVDVDLFGLLGGMMGGLGMPGDDPFDDFDPDEEFETDGADGLDDAGAEEPGGTVDADAPDGEFECLTQEDLAELEAFLDDESFAELEGMIELGLIELC